MSKMVNGRKRRGAFVAASEAVGGWRRKNKEVKEEDDDFVATTTPKRLARRRCRASKRKVAPSDEEQECKVVEVLTELVSLTDLLYSILPDYSDDDDDDGTVRYNKRRRVTTPDDDHHETAASTSSSSGTGAPHEDYSEDEGRSQQLETPYAYEEDSESAADESQETKPLPENGDDYDDEVSTSSGDEHHEGNDYDDHFEASTSADEGSGRLWEAGDDHAVYASSDCCMVDDNCGQDDGEELDVGETIGSTPAGLDLLESDFGLITARYESDGGYVGEQATLFLPWAFVAESSSASASASAPSMMSLDPTTTTLCDDDAFWSLCNEATDDSTTSWLSSLSLLSVPPAMPTCGLACEEELSDELSTEPPLSCAGVVETPSLAAADSWLNSVFV
jgi:hypothetical protein